MFNLLMFHANWDSGRASVPTSRIFEHTDPHIADQFREGGNPVLESLIKLPCLFCGEGMEDEIANIGQINRARISGNEVILETSFDRDVPPLTNGMMYDNRIELDMRHEFEFSRNHWAVKDVDLYRFLLRNVRPRRQRPTVFNISEHESLDPHLASAMMPFSAGFSSVYDSIRQAVEDVGLRCRRADDIWENPAIIQDVVALIDRSRVVICDCTGRNPNVFYEAGIAHTLGREVILVTQNAEDIPFDLRHLRYVHYHNNDQGRDLLADALRDRIQTIIGH